MLELVVVIIVLVDKLQLLEEYVLNAKLGHTLNQEIVHVLHVLLGNGPVLELAVAIIVLMDKLQLLEEYVHNALLGPTLFQEIVHALICPGKIFK